MLTCDTNVINTEEAGIAWELAEGRLNRKGFLRIDA